jgi:hypothetical protein
MNSIRRILIRTLVRTFYMQHAGLLLFVFYIFFGVVNGSELLFYHVSLVRAVLDSPLLLLLVMAVWMLYAGKAVLFLRSQILKEEMSFLILFENLPPAQKKIQLFIVQALIMLPVLVYGSFITAIGWQEDRILQSIMIFIVLAIFLIAPVFITGQTLNRTQRKFTWLKLRRRFTARMEFVYVRCIFRNMNFGLAISKILSLLLIFGLLTGFGIDHYDVRLPLLAMLVAAATHSMIVFNLQQFEVHKLSFMRQVPVSFLKRMLPLVSTYFFILLPESILLLRVYMPVKSYADLPVILLFGMLWLTALHALCYYNEAGKERFQFVVFFFIAICFFLTLHYLGT